MAAETCNHRKMKTMNTGAILSVLAKRGPMSRIGLTKALKLDGTTVTHLARELLASRLIESCGFSETAIGRPKQLLRLKANGRQAVGLQLEPHKVSGGVINLQGQIKAYETIAIEAGDSRNILLRKMRMIGQRLLKKSVKSRLMGIGLAYHGIVDRESGIVLNSARLPMWKGVNVYQFLKKTFKLPFAIDDSTRNKAIAEYRFGVARDIEDFILLDLGVGIGCAVVTGGRPLCGTTNSAGEIGHSLVVTNGKMCECGMRGCLETIAAVPAIENTFAEKFPDYGKIPFSEIAQMARQGHRGAVNILAKAGKYIGMTTSSLINILNPGHLVICGDLLIAGDVLVNAMKKALELHTIGPSYKALQIMRSQTGEYGAIIGAATLILSQVFNVEANDEVIQT